MLSSPCYTLQLVNNLRDIIKDQMMYLREDVICLSARCHPGCSIYVRSWPATPAVGVINDIGAVWCSMNGERAERLETDGVRDVGKFLHAVCVADGHPVPPTVKVQHTGNSTRNRPACAVSVSRPNTTYVVTCGKEQLGLLWRLTRQRLCQHTSLYVSQCMII